MKRSITFVVASLIAFGLYAAFSANRPKSIAKNAAVSDVVISQVYGGGGNAGAPFLNDFIELYNRGASPVSLNGWSVQYASATGTAWQVTNLGSFTLAPGQYYLVQEGSGGMNGSPLPIPNIVGTINMAATAGKVALVNNTTALTACPSANIIDLVGYGATANCSETAPAPAPSNTMAILRAANGATDTDNNSTDFAVGAPNPRSSGEPPARVIFDYDADAKADVSVFRPSTGTWYLLRSTTGFTGIQFGTSSDLIAPADFDGDAKTDVAVFRPSVGTWYILNSSNGAVASVPFGTSGDLPVPGDFDGDGKADVSVFRPSTGSWYRLNSSNGAFVGFQFGQGGDVPVMGDFDADAKADFTVYRPSAGAWYRINSGNGQFSGVQFGTSGDKPTAADYDGDGKTDISVFRSTTGAWYRLNSSNGAFVGETFGQSGDIPVAADYDGDGRVDLAVFRSGTWYILRSQLGFTAVQFGDAADKPTPAAFVP